MLPVFEPPKGIRAIYSDLDGTMLGYGGAFVQDHHGAPTLEPVEALLAARRAGVEIVPCSGRSMPGLAGDARLLGLRVSIGEMGAVLCYDSGREIVTALGEYPGGDQIPVRYMEAVGAVPLLLEQFRLEPHTPWSARREYTYLLRGAAGVEDTNKALAQAGHGWLELTDNGLLRGSYMGLEPGEAHAYHLLPRGVSKGIAIDADGARRGLRRDERVAIGDSVADLEMAPAVAVMVLTADSVATDAGLAHAAAAHANVAVTARPGNLGWADSVRALAAARFA
ncbi:MAG: HAD family hydrolase [Vicinamibacterales bacterium]